MQSARQDMQQLLEEYLAGPDGCYAESGRKAHEPLSEGV